MPTVEVSCYIHTKEKAEVKSPTYELFTAQITMKGLKDKKQILCYLYLFWLVWNLIYVNSLMCINR